MTKLIRWMVKGKHVHCIPSQTNARLNLSIELGWSGACRVTTRLGMRVEIVTSTPHVRFAVLRVQVDERLATQDVALTRTGLCR